MKLWPALLAALVLIACGSAAPAPVAGSPLSVSQLKFAVMDAVGQPVFCDSDFYPLARPGNEEASAIAKYPQIQADAEAYAAILAHEHIGSGAATDAEKLVVYRAWKRLGALTLAPAGSDYSFSYRVISKNGTSSYLQVSGSVRVDGKVTIGLRTPAGPPNCPICLAATTLISTPGGGVLVTDVKPGMTVWSAGADGRRVAEPVVEVGSTPVPSGHQMVRLGLADGRHLLASPGHRTADGRPLGSLRVGDPLDGSTITRWELVPYAGDRTYDLLPAGPTGRYWADGIVLSSTLMTPLPLPPAAGGR